MEIQLKHINESFLIGDIPLFKVYLNDSVQGSYFANDRRFPASIELKDGSLIFNCRIDGKILTKTLKFKLSIESDDLEKPFDTPNL